jgi:hypothetical protein
MVVFECNLIVMLFEWGLTWQVLGIGYKLVIPVNSIKFVQTYIRFHA